MSSLNIEGFSVYMGSAFSYRGIHEKGLGYVFSASLLLHTNSWDDIFATLFVNSPVGELDRANAQYNQDQTDTQYII